MWMEEWAKHAESDRPKSIIHDMAMDLGPVRAHPDVAIWCQRLTFYVSQLVHYVLVVS